MAPKSVTFQRHDHLVSVLFGDLLSHSYNIGTMDRQHANVCSRVPAGSTYKYIVFLHELSSL